MNTTAWGRVLALYWAFAWRACLTCVGLIIMFYLVAGPIESALHVPARAAIAFDLSMLLVLLLTGGSLALQWCSRAQFGEYQLRAEPEHAVGLRFAQAARVVWAQAWRSALVAVPTYLVGRWLLVPLLSLWFDFAAQLTYLPLSIAIGLWAMRAAISLQYRGFALRWIPERSVQRQAIDPRRANEVVVAQTADGVS